MSAADGWDLVVSPTDGEPAPSADRRPSRFRFAGIIEDGPADVASSVDAHLAEGFGRC